ncbi:Poly A polymerase, head domain-containing protein [Rozella allomycis CSF55]|uniref:Poly A polymerase, head domain-containing protein n=1 Tax=Rozella allomycis (strain CSF55) TaxID=988480 RepID=A0A075ATT3_ROZAC|nr:Poly A polymerase, head domain-containing protein [Rozella allomycis CSF55]|eukprot:EPZ31962.1 Poly A polymerase, head domain-containing protein [Rozella allomycis CSF55]
MTNIYRSQFKLSPEDLRTPENMIILNKTEEQICQVLVNCVKHYKLNVVCRIAGGWVRDKLLGISCDDIDVALDTMTGEQFAKKLDSYVNELKLPHISIGVIGSNPDKSKHLETATVKLFGHQIDFVNLRSEKIPSHVTFGTPLEDALRRDITINALFFNIHTKIVEDFTKRGLEDLKNRIIRTPLPPKETFLDDPLRILRTIRFASRFSYSIEKEIFEAVEDKSVIEAFHDKVSRERVRTELDKMFKHKNRTDSLNLIVKTKMCSNVFRWGCELKLDSLVEDSNTFNAVDCPEEKFDCFVDLYLKNYKKFIDSQPFKQSIDSIDQRLCMYGLGLLPLHGYFVNNASGKKRNEIPLVSFIATHSLKATNKDIKNLKVCVTGLLNTKSFMDNFPVQKSRKYVGLFLRSVGPLWPMCLLMASIHEVSHSIKSFQEIVQINKEIFRSVELFNLDGCWDMRPLLNGHELIDVLGIEKTQISFYSNKMIEWQLDNPEGTKEQAQQFLLN